ncbi:CidA/LrgA family protein [Sphingomonas sp. ac-8]|uniref:CidA/LrgA family protein n=1 Tax=Sphingomonas sp. ac-8 TaxID=3242977 RepID=UPI003A7F7F3A
MMIAAIALLLFCQLIGEALNRGLGVPLPGPVLGMFLLFAWLKLRPRERVELKAVTTWLIGHFAVLFVPATMGLVDEGPALARDGIAILVACGVATLLTLAVTALVFHWAAARDGGTA